MAAPVNVILNAMAYGLNTHIIKDHEYQALVDSDSGLMFESCTLEEVESTYLYGKPLAPAPMFEAITTTKMRIERTMKAFHRELSRQFASTEITPSEAEISTPRVSGGFATMTARFPLSDGQSISIIFHSPSGDPAKILDSDVLVAFRFLLNKRDVTPTVAPAGGADVSLKQVTLKLSNLAERNSAKFQASKASSDAKASELATLQAEVETKRNELNEIIAQANSAENAAADNASQAGVYERTLIKTEERIKKLKAQLAALSKADVAKEDKGESQALSVDEQNELDQLIKVGNKDVATFKAITGGDPAFAGFDEKAFSTSISGKVKRLHKNGKQGIVDGILAHLAQVNAALSKPMFTQRHSIWKLGTAQPENVADGKKPESPAKPKQDEATNETLTLVHYAKMSGDLQDVPTGAVNVTPQDQIANNQELLAAADNGGIFDAVGIVSYTQKLTAADIEKYNLVELAGVTKDDNSAPAQIADFKVEISNLVSAHFGKTWHEIGLEDPQALKQIVAGDPRFTAGERVELLKVVDKYIADKKVSDAKSIDGATELHWYGLRARPFMIGAAPRTPVSTILTNQEAAAMFPAIANDVAIRHGAIAYTTPLSAEDISSYEFVDLAALLKKKEGNELSEEDFDYVMADFIAVILDKYGEGGKIDRDVAESLIQSFSLSRNKIASLLSKTYTYEQRKEDGEGYQKLVTFRDSVTVKQIEDELMRYSEPSEPVAEPVAQPEPETQLEPQPETKPETQLEPQPETKPETQLEPQPETQPEPQPETVSVENIIRALEAALSQETDSEALMNLLESSIEALEAAGAYDDNEALVEQVSDRITELLEAEGA